MYLQKIKDFIDYEDYEGLHALYQPINRPSKYIFFLC